MMKRLAFLLGLLLAAPAQAQQIFTGSAGLSVASGAFTCTSAGVCTLNPVSAIATSVAIGGCTIAGNAICWAGTATTNGQFTSTLATGTAPFVVASTTNVANLNASSLSGATFAAPGPIGGTTASSIIGASITALATPGTVNVQTTSNASQPTLNFLNSSSGSVAIITGKTNTSGLSYDAGSHTFLTGGVAMPALALTSAAQTGTVCWTTSTGNLTVDTTTTCLLSNEDAKHDVIPIKDALAIVMKFEPVSYFYNEDQFIPGEQIGFTAQRMAKVDERLISRGQDGKPNRVRYQQASALYAGAIQELKSTIDILMAEIHELKATHLIQAHP